MRLKLGLRIGTGLREFGDGGQAIQRIQLHLKLNSYILSNPYQLFKRYKSCMWTYFHFLDRTSKFIVSLEIVIAPVNRRTVNVDPCRPSKTPLNEGWHKDIYSNLYSVGRRYCWIWLILSILKPCYYWIFLGNKFCYQSII